MTQLNLVPNGELFPTLLPVQKLINNNLILFLACVCERECGVEIV